MFTLNFNLESVIKPCIYCFRLKGSQRVYIGQAVNLKTRVKQHKYGWRLKSRNSHPKFYNAVKKYGMEAFELTVLAECEVENLDDLERFYIRKFNAVDEGFNICHDPCKSFLGRKHTEEYKAHMRELKLGVKPSPETLARMKAAKAGTKFPMHGTMKAAEYHRGRPKSKEQRAKMREAGLLRPPPTEGEKERLRKLRVGVKNTPESNEKRRITQTGQRRGPEFSATCKAARQKFKRSVSQFTKDGRLIKVHASATDAAHELGKDNSGNIASVCSGKIPSAYGFIWKYTDECTFNPQPAPITLNN